MVAQSFIQCLDGTGGVALGGPQQPAGARRCGQRPPAPGGPAPALQPAQELFGPVEVAQALDEALRHHQHLAMPFELGRTLLITGQLQRRAKRKALAKQHLEQALGIFESLPAPMWAVRAHAELSRIGLRPPAPLELTATEERVAALAASGRTNRQVAAELFLSPRTVEANLARAYRKLGVSTRAELGAAMTRRTPPSPKA